MPQKPMYSAVNNSPQTTLTAAIAASDSVIPVASVENLPAPPNLITIGSDDDAEVIRYNGIDGLTLTGCERGFAGTTAKIWLLDELVYRAYTKYDHDTFKENIEDLTETKLDTTGAAENTTISFATTAKRENIASGEKLGTAFGKIAKWISDFKALAFTESIGTEEIDDSAVSNAKLADMGASTIKGNAGSEVAPPADLSAADVRVLLNVSAGADVTESVIDNAISKSVPADGDKIAIIDSSAESGVKLKTILWSAVRTLITGSATPKMSGTAAVGTSSKFAREDHVHPSDTTRAKTDMSNVVNGSIAAGKLAAHSVSADYTATIGTGWAGAAAPYSIEVTVNGILASDTPFIDLNPSATYATAEKQIEGWGYIYRAVTAADKITFYATEKPTVAIPIKIKAVRK